MASISIKITGETENDPITEINCGTTSPKLGGDINISIFPELTGFACRNNDIKNISNFALNPNLQKIEIDRNKLTTINSGSGLSSNLYLQHFNCSDNLLTGNIFDMSLNMNLNYFNCSGNKLTGFTSGNEIPYTLSTFNANNNNLYQTSVDSILNAYVKNNRTSAYGTSDINLAGTNRHPSLTTGSKLVFSSGDNFLRSGTTLVTANVSGHGFSNGSVITVSGITNATQLNGTYIITSSSTNQFQYNTTGTGFATGSGTAVIRSTLDRNDGFRKYQILTLPTGQTIVDATYGDINGRGLNVQINSFFDAIQLGNTISGFSGISGQRDGLGYSVDTNDLGTRIIAGGPYSDTNLNDGFTYQYGVARVYELNNSNWIQIGQDIRDGEEQDDQFGWNVSMNSSGNRIAIGYYESSGASNEGATRIYEWNGSQWIQIGQTIFGSSSGDKSGYTVQLNGAGNRIAIAARFSDGGGASSGEVKIFEYNGSTWVQLGQAIYGNAGDEIANACINEIGDVVACSGLYSSAVRVYGWNGIEWVQIGQDITGSNQFGKNLSLNSVGDIFITSNNSTPSPLVFVYKYNGSTWIQLGQTLTRGLSTGSTFGDSLSINAIGDRIAIGDWNRNSTIGTVEIHEYNGSYWERLVRDLNNPLWNNTVDIGWSVTLNKLGDRVVAGGPNITGGWVQTYQLPEYPI